MAAPASTSSDLRAGPIHCLTCPLRHLCLPASLDDADVDAFDAIVRRDGVLPAGVDVVLPGEPLHSIHILRVGVLKEFVETVPGGRRTAGYSLPSDMIGFDGFAAGVHVTGARSRETASLCKVSRQDLLDLGRRFPQLLDQALVEAGRRLVETQRMQMVISRHTARERVAALLLGHAERAARLRWSDTHLRLPLSYAEIAEALGVSAAALSRTFRSLGQEGSLRVQRSEVEILDPQRLRELADGPVGSRRSRQR